MAGTRHELSARVLTSLAEVEKSADAWDELRVQCSASAFISPHLLTAWLANLGTDHRPFVVVVEDADGRLRAVAPLVRRGRLAFNLPGRALVAGELLVSPADSAPAWVEVVRTVCEHREVSLTILPCLTPGAEGVAGARAACKALGVPHRAWHRFERYRLPLEGSSLEAWLATWSRNGRQQLGKKRRRLERRGELVFRRLSGPDGYPIVRELHLKQWPTTKTVSWLHTPAGERVDKALAEQLSSGTLVLELDGKPLAGIFWLDSGTRRTAYYAGRDLTFEIGAPGELVFVDFVRRAFEDGVTELDTMGYGRAKDHWRLELQDGWELAFGPKNLAGRLTVATRRAQLRLRRRAVFAPEEDPDDRSGKTSTGAAVASPFGDSHGFRATRRSVAQARTS